MADDTPRHAQFTEHEQRDLEAVHAAVFGDGQPEKSLLVRMQRVEQRLGTIQKVSVATLCGVGALLMRIVGAWVEQMVRS